MMRVAITTLGCKANWSDSEAVSQALAGAGIEVVGFDDEADAYIVNTCTVTVLAAAQSRQMLRRARKTNPRAVVVACGCLGEISPDSVRRIAGVDRVFGARDREGLISYILERAGVQAQRGPGHAFGVLPLSPQSRARAFLKIQDGCDKSCAYCIITKARGASRSLPLGEALSAARALSRRHREIILAGIDIGQYGRDLSPRTSLVQLAGLLAGDPAVSRIRLSSLDPNRIDGPLVDLIAAGGVCRHVHLSIQSLADPVLARMRRGYSAADARHAAQRLAAMVPGIAITGDIIAGLPGETDSDHGATIEALRAIPMAGLHVFPFSPMQGTDAAAMEGQVPHCTRRARAATLRAVAAEKRKEFLNGLIGVNMDVIVTSREAGAGGTVTAFSDNAVAVTLPAGRVGYAQMGRARITEVSGTAATGVWE